MNSASEVRVVVPEGLFDGPLVHSEALFGMCVARWAASALP